MAELSWYCSFALEECTLGWYAVSQKHHKFPCDNMSQCLWGIPIVASKSGVGGIEGLNRMKKSGNGSKCGQVGPQEGSVFLNKCDP